MYPVRDYPLDGSAPVELLEVDPASEDCPRCGHGWGFHDAPECRVIVSRDPQRACWCTWHNAAWWQPQRVAAREAAEAELRRTCRHPDGFEPTGFSLHTGYDADGTYRRGPLTMLGVCPICERSPELEALLDDPGPGMSWYEPRLNRKSIDLHRISIGRRAA